MNTLRKFFLRLHLNKNGRLFGYGTSPEADWEIILISAMLLAVVVIGISAFVFIKIDKGEIFVVEKPMSEIDTTINLPLLRETVLYYQNKESNFNSIKSNRTSYVDPSL